MIRLGQSQLINPKEAVREFYTSVFQENIELVIFFCSNEFDLDIIAEEINSLFRSVKVIGCTTAGEIGSLGYLNHSISGMSFQSDTCSVVTGVLENLNEFSISQAHDLCQKLLQELEHKVSNSTIENKFALMLIDGLSIKEESVAYSLQRSLGAIPLFGGSAADGLNFSKTYVFNNGNFYCDSVILILMSTSLPFKIFKTQHFVSTQERLVVTQANTKERIVQEINGIPATEEYARLLGIKKEELNHSHFAASPVVVMIDGTDYVRSIQKANPDGSLTFFCAIEEGLVFRVAHGSNLIKNLEETFENIYEEIGKPQFVIVCDCILRNEEAIQNNQKTRLEEIFRDNNTIGFSSYGEQYCGVHVNQTLTGIAIGNPKEDN
jgi:hypothetical protein